MRRALRRNGPVGIAVAAARGSLWPIPAMGVALAVVLGILLPDLDRSLDRPKGGSPLTFAFSGGPSAAREVLSSISTALISVTGLVFSLTVVALQLSSSQYTPRLLQTFVTDRFVQLTLAQLVLTFVYSLMVLRTVRTQGSAGIDTSFVPGLSVTVAYVLTVMSALALVLFLGHLSRQLRIETMLRDVHDEVGATVHRELDDGDGSDGGGDLPAGAGRPVEARSSGFLVAVDEEALVSAAREQDAVVLLAARIGDGVVAGTPAAHVWPARPGGTVDVDAIGRALDEALELSFERQTVRDFVYSVRKMVDVVLKAISPAVNAPTTAVHALSHISAVVSDLVTRPLEPLRLRDDDGALRVVEPQWDAGTILALAVEEPLAFASGQPAVLRRIAQMLREIAWRAPAGRLDAAVRHYADRTVELARSSTDVAEEELDQWCARVEDALAGRWPEERPDAIVRAPSSRRRAAG